MNQRVQQHKRTEVRDGYRKSYLANGEYNTLGRYRKILNDYDEGEPLLTLGPDYVFFLIAFLIANTLSLITIFKIKNEEKMRPFFFLLIVILIYLDVVWLATALINPGIASGGVGEDGEVCQQCLKGGHEIIKIKNRQHCKECQICIDEQMVHFKLCGGCIGKHNFISFKLLLLGIFLWGLSLIVIIPQVLNLF